ncbi:hypothetical protein [Streptomyces sp. KS 21]|uniref:hypothetical protein n=1 Tax=Streptomyces sp. KS 21 TaxID=2485150 RepID=UPI001063AB3C|nr:hypothetical protein [Streptomyces sp. KS 21]TDU80689.1 hypothetical protein EDD91_7606 [Streptomyces sp. KS 21]
MSARDERAALTPGTSLHDHALFRHGIEPDGRIPFDGYPLPDGHPPENFRNRLRWSGAHEKVTAALVPLLADPDPVRAAEAVHLQVATLAIPHGTLRGHVVRLVLADEDAARRTARHLVHNGTSAAAVTVGMALLIRLGEAEDVPHLKALGMLRGLAATASAALEPLDRQAAALLKLRGLLGSHPERALHTAASTGGREATRTALLSIPDTVFSGRSRGLAEAADLHGLLLSHPEDPEMAALALRLLGDMCHQRDHRTEILDYGPAVPVYTLALAQADRLPPAPEHRALLLSTALDLHSGPAALLDWGPGSREALLDVLERAVSGGAEGASPLLEDWIRRHARLPFARTPVAASPGGPPTLQVAPVQTDVDTSAVETRFLVDGLPLLPALFRHGPGNAPEFLIDYAGLRAGPEPREVQLAQAYCSEGCCGALYVTIRRDGAEVVWEGWRGVDAKREPPPDYRFDAAAYDAEVERVERDLSWCWPARRTARLITTGLRERPGLLVRWGLTLRSITTDHSEPHIAVMRFVFLAPDGAEDRHGRPLRLYFDWRLPDDGSPPEERAAAALERIGNSDPTGFAQLQRGSSELAAALGYSWADGSEQAEQAEYAAAEQDVAGGRGFPAARSRRSALPDG